MTTHRLKTHPEPFLALYTGAKRFEIRRDDDRVFRVGDVLELLEWVPGEERYTGATVVAIVTYVLRGPGYGVPEGHCIMSTYVTNRWWRSREVNGG